MFCSACGQQIGDSNVCPSCGNKTDTPASTVLPPLSQNFTFRPGPTTEDQTTQDQRIRRSLARFTLFEQNLICPNCKYAGPMGVIREQKPFYANCAVLIILAITLVGLVVVLLLAILGKLSRTHLVECPQCGCQFSVPVR